MTKLTDINEIINFLANYFKANKSISMDTLKENANSDILESAYFRFTIDYLISQGAIIEKKDEKNLIFEIKDLNILNEYIKKKEQESGKSIIFSKKELEMGSEKKENIIPLEEQNKKVLPNSKNDMKDKTPEQITPIFTYTIPHSKIGEMNKLKNKFKTFKIIELSSTIKELLQNAKCEVLISSPFLDSEGIIFILEELKILAKNHVKLKILTRGITKKNYATSDWKHVRRLMGIRNIFQIYEAEEGKDLFYIKNYNIDITPSAFNVNLHSEGIHQKMILVDGSICYLGSGELTLASIYLNGECGVILRGEIVKFWHDFFFLFWNSPEAKEINIEKINFLLS